MRIRPINKFIKITFGSIFGEFEGITLCPFGIYMDKFDMIILNHEKIHWRQQREMLVLPFYLWYIIELLLRRINKPYNESYMSLAFEREAYEHQHNLNYLSKRKPYSWVKYLKNNKKK